jgi:hypothetical protein
MTPIPNDDSTYFSREGKKRVKAKTSKVSFYFGKKNNEKKKRKGKKKHLCIIAPIQTRDSLLTMSWWQI